MIPSSIITVGTIVLTCIVVVTIVTFGLLVYRQSSRNVQLQQIRQRLNDLRDQVDSRTVIPIRGFKGEKGDPGNPGGSNVTVSGENQIEVTTVSDVNEVAMANPIVVDSIVFDVGSDFAPLTTNIGITVDVVFSGIIGETTIPIQCYRIGNVVTLNISPLTATMENIGQTGIRSIDSPIPELYRPTSQIQQYDLLAYDENLGVQISRITINPTGEIFIYWGTGSWVYLNGNRCGWTETYPITYNLF